MAQTTIFQDLPFELRSKFWLASLEPRTLIFEYQSYCQKLKFHAKPPQALVICRESRSIVEHLYSLCFGSALVPVNTRINFKVDTIFLHGQYLRGIALFLAYITSNELLSIRRLAIEHKEDHVQDLETFSHGCRHTLDGTIHRFSGTCKHRLGDVHNLLERAIQRRNNLKELIIVYDVSQYEDDFPTYTDYTHFEFFKEPPADSEGWPVLPDAETWYIGLTLERRVRCTDSEKQSLLVGGRVPTYMRVRSDRNLLQLRHENDCRQHFLASCVSR